MKALATLLSITLFSVSSAYSVEIAEGSARVMSTTQDPTVAIQLSGRAAQLVYDSLTDVPENIAIDNEYSAIDQLYIKLSTKSGLHFSCTKSAGDSRPITAQTPSDKYTYTCNVLVDSSGAALE